MAEFPPGTHRFSLRAFWVRIVAVACACLAALGAALVALNVHSVEKSLSESFRDRVEDLKPVLNAAIAGPLQRGELEAVTQRIADARSDDGLAYLVLRDELDRPVAAVGREASDPPPLPSESALDGSGIYHGFMLVEANGRKIGTLNFGLSTQAMEELRSSLIRQGAVVTLLAVSVAAMLAALLAIGLGGRLAALSEASIRVAEGNYHIALDESGSLEVARLAASMNRMSAAVREHMRELAASEARLRLALAAGAVVTWEGDLASGALEWGPGAARLLGCADVESGIPPIESLLSSEHRERFAQARDAAIAMRSEFRIDVPLRWRDGTEHWIALRGKFVDGAPRRLLGVARDITEGKLAEHRARQQNKELEQRVRERTAELESAVAELKAANRELEAFSYTISHDLRAPLRTISGMAGILREDFGAAMADGGLAYLERIDAASQRLGRMVDDLLGFSRISRVQLHPGRVDMRSLVHEVMAQLPPETLLRAEIVVGELPEVRGDLALLRQVWTNLVGNALKFSRGVPGARVEISGRHAGGYCEYRVRDNGVGFDPAHSSKLFGVFERLHRAEDYEGTGVGLAIVHRIVTRHGGTVGVTAAPGRGAEFRFLLPAGELDRCGASGGALRAVA